MKNNILKNKLIAACVIPMSFLSSSAFAAVDTGTNESIKSAVALGLVSVALVIAGVISVSALSFGMNSIVKWLNR